MNKEKRNFDVDGSEADIDMSGLLAVFNDAEDDDPVAQVKYEVCVLHASAQTYLEAISIIEATLKKVPALAEAYPDQHKPLSVREEGIIEICECVKRIVPGMEERARRKPKEVLLEGLLVKASGVDSERELDRISDQCLTGDLKKET